MRTLSSGLTDSTGRASIFARKGDIYNCKTPMIEKGEQRNGLKNYETVSRSETEGTLGASKPSILSCYLIYRASILGMIREYRFGCACRQRAGIALAITLLTVMRRGLPERKKF